MKKLIIKTSCIALMTLFLGGNAFAQISHGGAPIFNKAKQAVEHITLPTVDNKKYLEEDMTTGKGTALRVAVLQNVNISNSNQGTVTRLADGTQVWRTAISSPGATHMALYFSQYDIPEGAQLFVYDADGEFVIGSFTRENATENNTFHTQVIPGSEIIVEYVEPADVAGQGRLTIDRVQHGYKELPMFRTENMKGHHGEAEGDCHINVKCPEGDDWRDQIRATVCYEVIAGPYVFCCTGTLVNNTAQDRSPLILSAYHCQDLDEYGTISNWTFYFNYETNSCTATNGSAGRSMTNCDIVAKYSYESGSDMLLLRLKSNIPDSYKVYYAGWDRSPSNPSVGVAIHHPGGDFKKISIPRTISSANGQFHEVYWYSGSSNKGVTEQGSSGSAFFNADKRVVGQLYAGSSACDNTSGSDYYGKLSKSWNGGGSSSNRVKDYLDPTGSNVMTLDGINYTDDDVESISEVSAKEMSVYPNPSTGMIYINLEELGMANYKVFDLSGRCVMEGSTILTTTAQAINLKSLSRGAYRLVVFTSDRAYSSNIILQ